MSVPPNEYTVLTMRIEEHEKAIQEIKQEYRDVKTQIRQTTSDQVYDLRFSTLEGKIDVLSHSLRDLQQVYSEDQKEQTVAMKNIHDALYRLQIGALAGLVTFFLAIISGIIIYLVTHNLK